MLLDLAVIAAAALAGWSWWSAARLGRPFSRREGELLAVWGVTSAVARLVQLLPGEVSGVVAAALLAVASCFALVAIAGIVRRITALIGGLGKAVAESALISASATTLVWVIGGFPLDPTPAELLRAVPAAVDLAAAALVARLGVLVPETVRVASNRRTFLVCGVAVVLAAGGNALGALRAFDVPVPAELASLVVIAGYLGAASVPRLPQPPTSQEQPVPRVRALPYVLVSAAVIAVVAQALASRTGPMQVILVSTAVVSLVAAQAFNLQENAALVASLTASRHRLTALVENTSDLIVRLDTNGRVVAANAAAVRLLHRTPHSLSGRSFDDVARAEDRRAVREAVLDVTRGRRDAAQVELRLAPPATGTAQLRLRAVPGGAVANLNDVTDSVELRQRLERLARYDQMTGLVNRAHLLEVVDAWLAEPAGEVAVLYADLDGFKAVNDRFGHGAGDRVLTEVAGRFDALVGAVDARRAIVGRFGGDEFVMALDGIPAEHAAVAAQQVVEAISPSFEVGDRTVTLGVSVGVAGAGPSYGEDLEPPAHDGLDSPGERAAELVHRADLAMYEAKAAGRARVGSWTPALEEQARRRVDIALGLRVALDTGRLAVAYQPIVRLSDGVVVGAEALLRLPPGVEAAALAPGLDELVSPAELVAVAEDTGIITEMGEWVLTQAVQEATEWSRLGHSASVSVNMSVHQLVSPAFVDSVRSILRACGLPASRLVLELTESQLAGHTGPAVQALEQLRAAGVRVAIDDFGTGYSSLSYLRRMPAQLVKLDRTLLDDVGVDPRATALARSVVAMARDLGLQVVAEGMEDLESVRLMRDLGAYAGQGFALSPALPADGMLGVLAGPPLRIGHSRAGLEPPGVDGGQPPPAAPATPVRAEIDLRDAVPHEGVNGTGPHGPGAAGNGAAEPAAADESPKERSPRLG